MPVLQRSFSDLDPTTISLVLHTDSNDYFHLLEVMPFMRLSPFRPALTRAFTLIELLVVVAIIAILAAIAVPNFLEAQVRSKVSRVRSDLRTLATGIESYTIDNNRVPFDGPRGGDHRGWATVQSGLTTPIAYLTSLLPDVFQDRSLMNFPPAPNTSFFVDSNNSRHAYDYGTAEWHGVGGTDPAQNQRWVRAFGYSQWKIGSCGPDLEFVDTTADFFGFRTRYDATNGTVSKGDIYRSQGTTQ